MSLLCKLRIMLPLPLLEHLELKTKTEANIKLAWDIVRKKWIQLTPEEYVRQALLHYFIQQKHYPIGLIAVEKQIKYGSLDKRYDIVVFDRKQAPWLLVECKAPGVPITQNTLYQLLQYHSQIPCPYWLLSNGMESHCAQVSATINWLNELPQYPTD
ncbi:MAG: type I restriction enzyme HsdR N-terminal domain-containing protein [Phycisphaerales bacterium]|nr:type I restriction enzyme HsdR N-terminal domain-containing protein [Phycisphaerales bacterium]